MFVSSVCVGVSVRMCVCVGVSVRMRVGVGVIHGVWYTFAGHVCTYSQSQD